MLFFVTTHIACDLCDCGQFFNSLNFELSICKMNTGQDFYFKISAALKFIKLKCI